MRIHGCSVSDISSRHNLTSPFHLHLTFSIVCWHVPLSAISILHCDKSFLCNVHSSYEIFICNVLWVYCAIIVFLTLRSDSIARWLNWLRMIFFHLFLEKSRFLKQNVWCHFKCHYLLMAPFTLCWVLQTLVLSIGHICVVMVRLLLLYVFLL